MTGVNLIAAFTNTGEFLCTVNCGNTNNNTFGYFLIRLSEYLDKRSVDWRKHSVLMMDNVVFHRAPATKQLIRDLRLPVLYLGPYHFRMAPVEMAFNYIKAHPLPTQQFGIRTR